MSKLKLRAVKCGYTQNTFIGKFRKDNGGRTEPCKTPSINRRKRGCLLSIGICYTLSKPWIRLASSKKGDNQIHKLTSLPKKLKPIRKM